MGQCWRRKDEVEAVVVDRNGDSERANGGPDAEMFELVDVWGPEEVETMIGEMDGVCVWREIDNGLESVEVFFAVNAVDAVFPNVFGSDVVE